MKIIIVYHEKRKKVALIQYNHLRSFFRGEIHYICDGCPPPVDEPYTIVHLQSYSRQKLWDALANHVGLVCVLDCDRLFEADFLQDVELGSAIYPKYLYYTKKEYVGFNEDLSIARKEKLIDIYREVCCSKVPTSGTTIFHVEDWERYRSNHYLSGYGFGDVATFLDMQRGGIRFIPSNAPVLHLHHDYDIPQKEFVRQNVSNANRISQIYNLPVGQQIKLLPLD